MRNPYEVLEVSKDATEAEIKKAYRRLVLKFHPDRNQNEETAPAQFREVEEAYTLLCDPAQKKILDETGLWGEGLELRKVAIQELRTLAVMLFVSGTWNERHLCREMERFVKTKITQCAEQKAKVVAEIEKFQNGIKRAKSKGKGNLLAEAFSLEIVGCQNQEKQIDEKLKLMEEMLKQLDLLDWVMDRPAEPTAAMFPPEFFKNKIRMRL